MVHTKSVSELSTGDLSFLRSLDTQAVYDRMAKVQLGGGKCTIACNFCGSCFKNPKAVTAHLLNDCPVAGLRRNGKKGRRQSGGGRKSSGGADHFYAELRQYEVLTDDQLQRKVYELCGIMVPSGTPRMTMLNILNEFARIYRKDIKKRELQMYLQRLLQEVIQNRHVLPYQGAQNSDEIAQLAAEVQRLNHLLAECRSKQGECRSGIAFAEVQRGSIAEQQKEISADIGKLMREKAELEELNRRLMIQAEECEREKKDLERRLQDTILELERLSSIYSGDPKAKEVIIQLSGVLSKEAKLKKAVATSTSALDNSFKRLEALKKKKATELESLTGKVTNLEARKRQLEEDIRTLEQSESRLRNVEIAGRKTEIATLDEQIVSARDQLQSLQETIDQLAAAQQTVAEGKGETASAALQLKGLAEDLRKCQEEKASLLKELEGLRGQKRQFKAAQGELAELRKAASTAESQYQAKTKEVESLSKQVTGTAETLNQLRAKIALLEEMIGADRGNLSEWEKYGYPIKEVNRFFTETGYLKSEKGLVPLVKNLTKDLEAELKARAETKEAHQRAINELMDQIDWDPELEPEKQKEWVQQIQRVPVKRFKNFMQERFGRPLGYKQQISKLTEKLELLEQEKARLENKQQTMDTAEEDAKKEMIKLLGEMVELSNIVGLKIKLKPDIESAKKMALLDLIKDAHRILTSQVADIRIYVSNVVRSLASANSEIQDLRSQLGKKETQRKEAYAAAAEAIRRLQECEAALEKATGVAVAATERSVSERATKQFDTSTVANLKTLRANLAKCESDKATAERNLASIQEEMVGMKTLAEYEALEALLASAQKDVKRLRGQLGETVAAPEIAASVEELQRQLVEKEKIVASLQKQLAEKPVVDTTDLARRLSEAESAAEAAKSAAEAVQKEKEQALSDLEKIAKELGKPGQNVAQLVQRVKELTVEKTASEKAASEAMQRVETVSAGIQVAESRRASLTQELQSQLSALRLENEGLRKELESRTKELADAKRRADDLETEKDSWIRKIADLTTEVSELKKTKESVEKLSAKISAKDEAAQKTEAKLQSDLKAARKEAGELRTQISELPSKQRLEELESARAAAAKRVGELESELFTFKTTRETEIAASTKELAAQEIEVKRLKAQLEAERKRCIEEKAAEVAAIQAELEASQQLVKELEAQVQGSGFDLEPIKKQLEAVYKSQLESKLLEKETELNRICEEQLTALREEIRGHTGTIESLQAQLDVLRTPKEAVSAKESELDRKSAELVSVVSELERESEQLLASLGKQALAGPVENIDEIKEELRQCKENLAEARAALKQVSSVQKELKTPPEAVPGRIAELEAKLEAEKAKVQSITKNRDKLQTQLVEQGTELASLQRLRDNLFVMKRLETELRGKISDCEDALAAAAAKEKNATENAAKVPGLEKELGDLRQKLETAEQERDDCRAVALVAEEEQASKFAEWKEAEGKLQTQLEAVGSDDGSSKEVTGLRKELEQLRREYDAAIAERDKANAKSASLKSEIESLRAVISTEEGKINVTQKEFEEGLLAKSTVAGIQEELRQTKSELDDLKPKLEEAEREAKELRDAAAKHAGEIAELAAKVSSVETGAASQVEKLSEQLSNVKAERDSFESQLTALRKTMETQETTLQTTLERAEKAEAELESVKKELAEAKSTIGTTLKGLEPLKTELERLRTGEEAAQKTLASEKSTAMKEAADAHAAEAKAKKEVETLTAQIDPLQEALQRANKEKEAIRAAGEGTQGIIDQHNATIKNLREELQSIRDSRPDELEAAKQPLAKQLAALTKVNEEHLAKRRELNAANIALRTSIGEAEARVRKLEGELKSARTLAKSAEGTKTTTEGILETERERHGAAAKKAADDIQALRRQLAEKEVECKKCNLEKEALESRIESLDRDHKSAIGRQKDDLERQIRSCKEELRKAVERAEKAEADLEKLKETEKALRQEYDAAKKNLGGEATTLLETAKKILVKLNKNYIGISTDTIEVRLNDILTKVVKLVEERDALKASNEDLTRQLREANIKSKDIENECDRLKASITSLEQATGFSIDTIPSKLSEQTAEAKKLGDELARLKVANVTAAGKVESELEALRNQAADNLRRATTAEGVVTQLKSAMNRVESALGLSTDSGADEIIAKFESINTDLDALRQESGSLRTRAEKAEGALEDIKSELENLKSTNADLDAALKQCQSESSEKDTTISELRSTETRLRGEVADKEEELAAEKARADKLNTQMQGVCDASKRDLESAIASLDGVSKTVPDSQWNIYITKATENVANRNKYNRFNRELKEIKEGIPDCPDGYTEIMNRLSMARGLQSQSNEIALIINDALAARKGLELGRDCTKEYETLKELVENYGEERRVLAEKIVKSIDDRIINAKISPELRAIRFKYLSLSGGQVYNETAARTVQGLYARVAEVTQDIIRNGSTAIKSYEELYEAVKEYIKPENVSRIPPEIEAKAKEFAGVCRSIDEEITRFKNVEIVDGKTITNDQLINDFEDISGTVRVYVRINDFDVQQNALISTYIRKTADSTDCSRNIQFIPTVCGLPASETKEYRNFYSVFACAKNKHLYQGISKVYTKNNPLNCKGKLPSTVPSGVPSPTRCEFNVNSSRGLSTTIKQALSGYRIAVFGYGYSGSGKTFTLFGNPESDVDGIVQEAFKDPSVYSRISRLEIPSIVELYGQGTYRGAEDYPKRIIQRGRVRTKIDYINEFKETLIDKTAVKGILDVVGKKINVNIGSGNNKGKNIAKTIDFINERLTQMRRINGSIKSTPNNPESSRGHLFITFKITTDDGTVGEFIVADFGGIEDPAKIIKYYFPGELKNIVGAIGATYKVSLPAIENFLSNLQPHANIQLGTMKNFIQNATFGKKLNNEYKNLKKMYSTSNIGTFVNNDSYTLIGQFKFEGEEATEELIKGLYEKGAIRREPKTVKDILNQVKNANKEFYDNVLVSKPLDDFVNKFGLNLEETQSDMVLLKLRFDSGFRSVMGVGVDQAKIDDGYVKFKLFLAVQIIREGFYINETLNEMKAYFRHQQGIYPNLSINEVKDNEEKSFELLNDLNSQFRSTIKMPPGIATELGAKRDSKGNLLAYNEFATFYRPLFSGESIVSLQKQKGSLLATGIRNINQVIDTVKFERITDFVGARTTEFDPVGMLSMLELINKGPKVREGRRIDVSKGRMQAMSERFTTAPGVAEIIRPGEEEERREKPSKFVLIALVRPDTEEKEVTVTVLGDGTKQEKHSYAKTTKYCDGTKAALDFAEQISSTRITN